MITLHGDSKVLFFKQLRSKNDDLRRALLGHANKSRAKIQRV